MKRIRILAASAVWVALLFSVPIHAQQSHGGTFANQEFFAAIKKGDTAKVQALLKEDSSLAKLPNDKGTTPVLFAVYTGHKEIAGLLIAAGVAPNIFEAAATGRLERVQELLQQNPELACAYSPDGWTALHLANFGKAEVVTLLLDRGADINAVSKNKLVATPLQGTVVMQRIALGRLLLERGAKVSPRGEEGTTPLHEAAGSGQMDFVKLLLARGAEVNARDNVGKTPLTIALDHKHREIAKLLQEHGGVD